MSDPDYKLLPGISTVTRRHIVEFLKSPDLSEFEDNPKVDGWERHNIRATMGELAEELEETFSVDEISFIRGVCSALSRLDTGSVEYLDIVKQAGGFEVLMEHAEEYDLEHLQEAKRRAEED